MIDDLVYFSSLLGSVSLGSFYKNIDDPEIKRNYGAGLGIFIACLICGQQFFHTLLLVWGNIIIIKCCDKRYLHQMSMTYTWLYLLYLHLNIPSYQYVIWLHQTMALRLVGLAFEVHNADKAKLNLKATPKNSVGASDVLTKLPTAAEIITYSYNFLGLHKGPYYRWKIFNDHFTSPFVTLGDYRVITEQKLKKTFVCALAYFLLRFKYSPEIYYERSFYVCYGTDFRFLSNVPQLMLYVLRFQIILLLSTAACTEAGFGVYPVKCLAIPGFGPSDQQPLLKFTLGTEDATLVQEYNFAMLKCFENQKLLIGPKMKDTVKSWDMSTGYWFWAYVYKNFSKSNKEVKSASSFLAWTLWCGPSLQQTILSSTLWFYIHLEAEYQDLFNAAGSMNLPWNIGFSIMRLFCLTYLTPCLVVSNVDVFLNYYNSIFWMFHLVLLACFMGAIFLAKSNLLVTNNN